MGCGVAKMPRWGHSAPVFGRIFLAMIMALALALGPLAMPGAEAQATPSTHHGEMAGGEHCDDRQPPKPGQQDKADKMCCVAGCMAVAALPTPVLDTPAITGLRQCPAPDRIGLGYLGEIATPPPRPA